MKQHHYTLSLTWTGNRGEGTTDYQAYDRAHTIEVEGKPLIEASSDTPFRGDASKYNPEDMFLASIAACHMLWYLHLCADAGVIVLGYTDHPKGILQQTPQNGGHFSEVTLYPEVTVKDSSMEELALELHAKAHQHCFIANSCNFPIHHAPKCVSVHA